MQLVVVSCEAGWHRDPATTPLRLDQAQAPVAYFSSALIGSPAIGQLPNAQ
jgi:hypothetical protein